jgi:DNA helicase-2/ATP-dependent DNA helicase PcrA
MTDWQRLLNPEQYQAVTASDGPLLVLAAAGTGKTHTLTYRVAYLI